MTTAPAPNSRPPGFFRGAWIIAAIELTQRRRSRTLLIFAIVWFCIIGAVTAVSWFVLFDSANAYDEDFDTYPLFSLIVYFVLLFGTLLAPAISAGSISSERTSATLATTQVTLVSTWAILLGKALAAWITGLAFLVIASPFVVLSLALGQFDTRQLLLALFALALQIGLFTAVGVGLSAIISSPVFAIVTAYLMVALLSIGTLIAFSLSLGLTTRYVEVESYALDEAYWKAVDECELAAGCEEAVPLTCEAQTDTYAVTNMQQTWWMLALNPYVVVADMVSARPGDDSPDDLFGWISVAVRSMQIPDTDEPVGWNDCKPDQPDMSEEPSADETLAATYPVWWIGLGLQLLIAAGTLWAGHARLRTPARRVPKGSRIA